LETLLIPARHCPAARQRDVGLEAHVNEVCATCFGLAIERLALNAALCLEAQHALGQRRLLLGAGLDQLDVGLVLCLF